MVFQAKHIPPSLRNFCDHTVQFTFMLAHDSGVENLSADYLSRLQVRREDRMHLKLTDFISVFQVMIDIASKTTRQKENEIDYCPRLEADENIRKHRSNNPDDKASGQKRHEHPRARETDIHQMTAHGDTGHRKKVPKDLT